MQVTKGRSVRPSAGNACSTASANDNTTPALAHLVSTTLSRSTSFDMQVNVETSFLCEHAGS
jgi:hypothetical protein